MNTDTELEVTQLRLNRFFQLRLFVDRGRIYLEVSWGSDTINGIGCNIGSLAVPIEVRLIAPFITGLARCEHEALQHASMGDVRNKSTAKGKDHAAIVL